MRHLKRPDRLYFTQSFLSQLLFMTVFTVNLLYYIQVVEMNPLQLVLIGTVLELTVLLCEIPTGLIADHISRKFSIVLGYLLIGLGFLMEGLLPSFSAILIAQIIWGIGYTCISGARQAWITDEVGLSATNSIFIRSVTFENVGNIIGIVIAIILGSLSLQASILAGATGFILLSLYLWYFMSEKNVIIKENKSKGLTLEIKYMLSSVFTSFRNNLFLRYILVIAFIVGVYSEGFDRLWVSHLSLSIADDIFNKASVLIIGSLQFIVAILTIYIIQYFNRISENIYLKKLYRGLRISYWILILSLFSFAISTNLLGLIIFYLLIQVNRNIMSTFENIWFNQLITDSSKRATFFSFKGQIDAVGQISGGPIVGLISQHFSIKVAIAFSALLLAPVLWIYNKLIKTRG